MQYEDIERGLIKEEIKNEKKECWNECEIWWEWG